MRVIFLSSPILSSDLLQPELKNCFLMMTYNVQLIEIFKTDIMIWVTACLII